MKEGIQRSMTDAYLGIKMEIESRLQLLNYWKNQINEDFEEVLSQNPIDEIKDLITQIEDALSRNKKLKVAIFMEESPDFRNQTGRQLNSLIIGSVETLNDNAEREVNTIKTAMSNLGMPKEKNRVLNLKRAV